MQRLASFLLFALALPLFTAAQPCPLKSEPGFHVVKKGETLYSVSTKYKISIPDLLLWNGIAAGSEPLPVCKQLIVKKPPASALAPADVPAGYEQPVEVLAAKSPAAAPEKPFEKYFRQQGGKHVLDDGETVASVARLYGYTEEHFRRFNSLTPDEPVSPGTVLGTTDCDHPDKVELSKATFPDKPEEFGAEDKRMSGKPADYYEEKREPAPSALQDKPDGWFEEKREKVPSRRKKPDEHSKYSSRRTESSGPKKPDDGFEESLRVSGSDEFFEEKKPREYDAEMPQPKGKTQPQAKSKSGKDSPPSSYEHPEELLAKKQQVKLPPPTAARKAATAYMTAEELKMLDEINLLRANPPAYAAFVEAKVAEMRSDWGWSDRAAAAEELIEELKATAALPLLDPSECLQRAAEKSGDARLKAGSGDQFDAPGSYPWNRIIKECPKMTNGHENLVGGQENVRDALLAALLDEGFESRGRRKNLLNRSWRFAACHRVGMLDGIPDTWVQSFGHQ